VSNQDRMGGLFLRNPFLLFTSEIYAVCQIGENCESARNFNLQQRSPANNLSPVLSVMAC
jgi:hypothetical protein